MKLSALCMRCLVQRQLENICHIDDEEKKADYMRKVLFILSQADERETAPEVLVKVNALHQEYFGAPYSFEGLKKRYNHMMLQKKDSIWTNILNSDDSLKEALKYARAGNYIDFGAMGSVDDKKLSNLLETVPHETIDLSTYQKFTKGLETAKELVYLTDNCGEVVLDKLFIKCIQTQFPSIHVSVIVRGYPILNDATVEDARMTGLTDIADVFGNGTEIAGTSLKQINQKAKDCIHAADIIISKGQGNFETLHGCGLNIYYLFLCKCEWFVKRFHVEQFKGVFINERDCNI